MVCKTYFIGTNAGPCRTKEQQDQISPTQSAPLGEFLYIRCRSRRIPIKSELQVKLEERKYSAAETEPLYPALMCPVSYANPGGF